MSRSYPLDEELDSTSDFPLLFRMLLLLLVFIGIGIVSDVGIDGNWLCFMLFMGTTMQVEETATSSAVLSIDSRVLVFSTSCVGDYEIWKGSFS